MRIESAAQILSDMLTNLDNSALDIDDNDGNALAITIGDSLRVLNINGRDLIDIAEQGLGRYTFAVLGDVANDHRVKVETELYKEVEELFHQVRNGTADLDAFFNSVLGRTL